MSGRLIFSPIGDGEGKVWLRGRRLERSRDGDVAASKRIH
jgi:hypothetical protein